MNANVTLKLQQQLKAATTLTCLIVFLGMGVMAQAVEDIGRKLAKDRSLPGKNHPGECAVYADALFAKMNAAGVEAYRVSFDWSDYLSSPSADQGAHAMVVYKDNRGRFYGVDNMSWKPVWLKGKNSQEWSAFFAGMNCSTSTRKTIASNAATLQSDRVYVKR